MVKLISDYRVKSVYDLEPTSLHKLGFLTLLIDLDNTLAPYDLLLPEQRTYELISKIKAAGLEVILISNNRPQRVKPYANRLEVNCIYSARKPFPGVLKKYLKEHSIDKQKTLYFGDQVINDMKMAKKAGLVTCLTDPISPKDHISAKLIRPLDRWLRKKYKKEGRLGKSLVQEEKGEKVYVS
jgi:HAD superfamily phosphatase (TIGR01668 family)